jgi:adenine-specific DNA-methyltransferase
MRYVPYSEIDDETYNIDTKEKEINKKFYGEDDE